MSKTPVYIICDNIRSLYNVGAIFRTSDAVNIKKIYLCGITGYPKEDDPKWFQTLRIEKTALGANKTVKWEYVNNTIDIISKLKSKGVSIYSLENTKNAKTYNKVKYKFPCALVLGHEVNGVNDKIINASHEVIKIPMLGKKTSLNVEAAYAISIYEILNQYLLK